MYHSFKITGKVNTLSEDEAIDLLHTALDDYQGLVVEHIDVGNYSTTFVKGKTTV